MMMMMMMVQFIQRGTGMSEPHFITELLRSERCPMSRSGQEVQMVPVNIYKVAADWFQSSCWIFQVTCGHFQTFSWCQVQLFFI